MGFKKHHEILIYTVPNNKLCELAKSYFRDMGMDYLEFNVAKDTVAQAKMFELSEQVATPVVSFDGRIIVGYRPDIYEQLLQADQKKKDDNED